jgi:hypothetical protein
MGLKVPTEHEEQKDNPEVLEYIPWRQREHARLSLVAENLPLETKKNTECEKGGKKAKSRPTSRAAWATGLAIVKSANRAYSIRQGASHRRTSATLLNH